MFASGDVVQVVSGQVGNNVTSLLAVTAGEVLTVTKPYHDWMWCTNKHQQCGYVGTNLLRKPAANEHQTSGSATSEQQPDEDSDNSWDDDEEEQQAQPASDSSHAASSSSGQQLLGERRSSTPPQDPAAVRESIQALLTNIIKRQSQGPRDQGTRPPLPPAQPRRETNNSALQVSRSEVNPPSPPPPPARNPKRPSPASQPADEHHYSGPVSPGTEGRSFNAIQHTPSFRQGGPRDQGTRPPLPPAQPRRETNNSALQVSRSEVNPPSPPPPPARNPERPSPASQPADEHHYSGPASPGTEGRSFNAIQHTPSSRQGGVEETADPSYWKVAISCRDQTFGDFEVLPGDLVKLVPESNSHELCKVLVQCIKTGLRGYIPETHIFKATALNYRPWFVGFMSREEAETRLWDTSVAEETFLVRESSNLSGYALSIKTRRSDGVVEIRHRRVVQKGGQFYAWKGFEHPNIEALVEAHQSARGENQLNTPYNKYNHPDF